MDCFRSTAVSSPQPVNQNPGVIMHQTPARKVLRKHLLTTLIVSLACWQMRAADKTWDGGGADNFWQTGVNWDLDAAPVPGPDSLIFGGSTRLLNTNDFAAASALNNITFTNGAGAFNLWGNQITLGANITSNSANVHTQQLGLNVAAV